MSFWLFNYLDGVVGSQRATRPNLRRDFRLIDPMNYQPSGFHAWCTRPESARAKRDRTLTVLVRASFDASRQRYGSPRIHADLLEQDERVSRKRVIRLMQAEGLKARVRKRITGTTITDPALPVAANLLDRQSTAEAPNRRWVGDTTEFVIGESTKLYLAAILDLYSRFIVGWAVSPVNDRLCLPKTRFDPSPMRTSGAQADVRRFCALVVRPGAGAQCWSSRTPECRRTSSRSAGSR